MPDENRWSEAVVGLVAFPAALVLAHRIRLRVSPAPLRATGPLGYVVRLASASSIIEVS